MYIHTFFFKTDTYITETDTTELKDLSHSIMDIFIMTLNIIDP